MVPLPVTTPSPRYCFFSMPKLVQRCFTNMSNSSKLPSSSSMLMRSRAVNLPFSCCLSIAFSPPPMRALARSSISSLIFSVCVLIFVIYDLLFDDWQYAVLHKFSCKGNKFYVRLYTFGCIFSSTYTYLYIYARAASENESKVASETGARAYLGSASCLSRKRLVLIAEAQGAYCRSFTLSRARCRLKFDLLPRRRERKYGSCCRT